MNDNYHEDKNPISKNGSPINVTNQDLVFCVDNGAREILRFVSDGKIYVHGKEIEADQEIIDGLREFLSHSKVTQGEDATPETTEETPNENQESK